MRAISVPEVRVGDLIRWADRSVEVLHIEIVSYATHTRRRRFICDVDGSPTKLNYDDNEWVQVDNAQLERLEWQP